MDDIAFDRTLAHAQAGYANLQDIIKFVDAKTGVITGFVTLTLGAAVAALQWIFDRQPGDTFCYAEITARTPLLALTAVALAAAGIAFGVLALLNALNGLQARVKFDNSRLTLLFPVFPAARIRVARRCVARLKGGLSSKEILEDYEAQLLQAGRILYDKAHYLGRATLFFKWQLLLNCMAAATIVLVSAAS